MQQQTWTPQRWPARTDKLRLSIAQTGLEGQPGSLGPCTASLPAGLREQLIRADPGALPLRKYGLKCKGEMR